MSTWGATTVSVTDQYCPFCLAPVDQWKMEEQGEMTEYSCPMCGEWIGGRPTWAVGEHTTGTTGELSREDAERLVETPP